MNLSVLSHFSFLSICLENDEGYIPCSKVFCYVQNYKTFFFLVMKARAISKGLIKNIFPFSPLEGNLSLKHIGIAWMQVGTAILL